MHNYFLDKTCCMDLVFSSLAIRNVTLASFVLAMAEHIVLMIMIIILFVNLGNGFARLFLT